MKPVNKYLQPLTVIVLLLFVVLGWAIGRVSMSNIQNASAQETGVSSLATSEKLKSLGLIFTPVDSTDKQAQGAVTKDQAVSAAVQVMPRLKAATGTDSSLGLLSNPDLQQAGKDNLPIDQRLADMGLVWVVTFHDIESASSGPPEAPHYISHEFAVVIDAKTGKYIVAFPFFDPTPMPSSG